MSETDLLRELRSWRDRGINLATILQLVQKVWMHDSSPTAATDIQEDRVREKYARRTNSWKQRYDDATRTR